MITYIKGSIKLSADLIAKSNAVKTAKQSSKPKKSLKLEKQYFRYPQENHSLVSSWVRDNAKPTMPRGRKLSLLVRDHAFIEKNERKTPIPAQKMVV